MRRTTAIAPAGQWDARSAADRVRLDADDRQRRRIMLTGVGGTSFLLDLEKPAALRDGDGLVLDDGSIVLVAGAAEPLVEVAARDIVRLAWHIGNRHADLEVCGDRLRIRRDHVLEDMLRSLGATLTPVEAAFNPEPGAPHDHGHEHGA